MSPRLAVIPAALSLLCACSGGGPVQGGPATGRLGAPQVPFDLSVLAPAGLPVPAGSMRLPDTITLPASYRLVMLEGHMALVRESDAQVMAPSPTSMRVVSGEIARGELAYQPALLPQELAAEVAANRESAARMDNALESVMRRSRALSQQAMEAQAQTRRMADLLASAEARIRELSPAPKAASQPPERTDSSGSSE
ncbi:MAG TPA: hypothetical protein VIJ19_07680 [Opitutaceae bacterium]